MLHRYTALSGRAEMRTPYELISKHIVSPLRILVAARLVEQGVSQHAAAKALGISQAAVNKYLSRVDEAWRSLKEAGLDKSEVNALVDSLAYYVTRDDIEGFLKLLMIAVNTWLTQGRLCDLHRRIDGKVPRECRVCLDFAFTLLRDPVLDRLEKAVEMLVSEPFFASLIPEVHSNIVECLPGAHSIYEVAGIPGRIARISGRAAAVRFRPEYGASRHLAKILLAVHALRHEIRALINIRFSEEIRRLLLSMGVSMGTVSGRVDEDDIAHAFGKEHLAVAHLGGHGIEPVIYLAGRDSLELASRVIAVARALQVRRNA